MDRRKFFGNLFGGVVAAAIAPALYAQILEQEYVVIDNGKPVPVPPERIFVEGTGIWVFFEGTLVGWSNEVNASIDYHVPVIDVTSMESGMYREFIPGLPSVTWNIEQLHIEDVNLFQDIFMDGKVVHIILKTVQKDGTEVSFDSDGIMTEFNSFARIDEKFGYSASFEGIGETIVNYGQDTDATDEA